MIIDTLIHDVKSRLDDEANTKLDHGDYIQSINQAIDEFSDAYPYVQKAALHTTANSRDIDIASLVDRITVEGVEYPTGSYPRSLVPFEVVGNTVTMLIGSAPTTIADVSVYWGGKQDSATLPTQYGSMIAQGASGYALRILAMKQRHSSAEKITTALTELAKMASGGVTNLADVDTALDNIGKWIADGIGADPAFQPLKTILKSLPDYQTGGANSILEFVDNGKAFINQVTDGSNVAGHYAQYAQAMAQLVGSLVAGGQARLSAVNGYLNEAMQRLNTIGVYGREARQYLDSSAVYLRLAESYQKEADIRVADYLARVEVVRNRRPSMPRPVYHYNWSVG